MACEDFEAGVIMDEVSDDNAILPLWEGKVVGKVKKIEWKCSSFSKIRYASEVWQK